MEYTITKISDDKSIENISSITPETPNLSSLTITEDPINHPIILHINLQHFKDPNNQLTPIKNNDQSITSVIFIQS